VGVTQNLNTLSRIDFETVRQYTAAEEYRTELQSNESYGFHKSCRFQ